MPSRLHVSVPAGQDYTHVVQIMYGKDNAQDKMPLRLILSEEDWDQGVDGKMRFLKDEETLPMSARPFVVFSPREQELVPGETGEVRVSIIVPEDTPPGEYRSAVIYSPRTPYRELKEGDQRLNMHLRLGTAIYVEVPPVSAQVEMVGLEVIPDGRGWAVKPSFVNRGEVHVRLQDEFEIYDMTGLDVDGPERGPLVVEREPEEAGIVLPGHDRFFNRPVPQFVLYPGTFRLVYRADPDRDLPIMEGETIFNIADPHGTVAGGNE